MYIFSSKWLLAFWVQYMTLSQIHLSLCYVFHSYVNLSLNLSKMALVGWNACTLLVNHFINETFLNLQRKTKMMSGCEEDETNKSIGRWESLAKISDITGWVHTRINYHNKIHSFTLNIFIHSNSNQISWQHLKRRWEWHFFPCKLITVLTTWYHHLMYFQKK